MGGDDQMPRRVVRAGGQQRPVQRRSEWSRSAILQLLDEQRFRSCHGERRDLSTPKPPSVFRAARLQLPSTAKGMVARRRLGAPWIARSKRVKSRSAEPYRARQNHMPSSPGSLRKGKVIVKGLATFHRALTNVEKRNVCVCVRGATRLLVQELVALSVVAGACIRRHVTVR